MSTLTTKNTNNTVNLGTPWPSELRFCPANVWVTVIATTIDKLILSRVSFSELMSRAWSLFTLGICSLFRKKTSESDVFLLSDVFILKNLESLISHFSLVIWPILTSDSKSARKMGQMVFLNGDIPLGKMVFKIFRKKIFSTKKNFRKKIFFFGFFFSKSLPKMHFSQ